MRIKIERFPDFDDGVWNASIKLSDRERNALGSDRLIFRVPNLPQRHFRLKEPFREPSHAASGVAYDGVFCSGEWVAIFSANGVNEQECITSLKEVEAALEIAIRAAMSGHSIELDNA